MEEFGELLGWVTAVLYAASLLDYFVKIGYKHLIKDLEKDSPIKQLFQLLMKFIVKYHRYFGMGAGVFALIHMFLQLANEDLSITGIVLTAMMFLMGLMGMLIAYGHNQKVLKIHRPFSFLILVVLFIHII